MNKEALNPINKQIQEMDLNHITPETANDLIESLGGDLVVTRLNEVASTVYYINLLFMARMAEELSVRCEG